ncbi:zf-HC2 domain-containing protein [Candidatus Hydrogenedentota bacterium]
MMDCEETRAVISAYLDGELGSKESDALLDHVETCESCGRDLEELQQVSRLYKELEEPIAPTDIEERVLSKVGVLHISKSQQLEKRPFFFRPAPALAAVLVAVVAGLIYVQLNAPRQQEMLLSREESDMSDVLQPATAAVKAGSPTDEPAREGGDRGRAASNYFGGDTDDSTVELSELDEIDGTVPEPTVEIAKKASRGDEDSYEMGVLAEEEPATEERFFADSVEDMTVAGAVVSQPAAVTSLEVDSDYMTEISEEQMRAEIREELDLLKARKPVGGDEVVISEEGEVSVLDFEAMHGIVGGASGMLKESKAKSGGESAFGRYEFARRVPEEEVAEVKLRSSLEKTEVFSGEIRKGILGDSLVQTGAGLYEKRKPESGKSSEVSLGIGIGTLPDDEGNMIELEESAGRKWFGTAVESSPRGDVADKPAMQEPIINKGPYDFVYDKNIIMGTKIQVSSGIELTIISVRLRRNSKTVAKLTLDYLSKIEPDVTDIPERPIKVLISVGLLDGSNKNISSQLASSKIDLTGATARPKSASISVVSSKLEDVRKFMFDLRTVGK